MRSHLTPEEFAACFVGSTLDGEVQQHARECLECSAELRRFGGAVDGLRVALRDRVNAQLDSQADEVSLHAAWEHRPGGRKWKWAVAAAVIVAGLLPVTMLDSRMPSGGRESLSASDASALMDSINLHLSRDLPTPMEPMTAPLVNTNASMTFGGIQ